ncbi:hypothetical protein D5086_028083 [Populus alba]|uniref:Uncharacterized protein n=1 Tax=Populus alba TaxID=43335 RepID=A0ACC4AX57_POPAL
MHVLVYVISLVLSGVADHGYCSDETLSLASSLLQVSLFQGYLHSFCEVCKSVDFLVIICWDVILMATRRDFEASKERPRFDGLGAARSLLYMRLLLADLVMPAEIAGERIRYRIDGSKIKKVISSLILGMIISAKHLNELANCLCFHLRTHHYENMAKTYLPDYFRLMPTAS